MGSRNRILYPLFAVLCTGPVVAGQSTGIDQPLLDKANAGEAAAQVTVGEKYAAAADVAQDLKQAAELILTEAASAIA